MIEYPFNTPMILTDALYAMYGGHTGTSINAQRQGAFLIAEKQMTEHIGTFLTPATVTGSHLWDLLGKPIATEYGHINEIKGVVIQYGNACSCLMTSLAGCAFILDDTYGYVLPFQLGYPGTCGCIGLTPMITQISYNAGYPSGSVYQADMLLALTMAAEINLNEIIDPSANEGTGDIGIQSFSNQQYREDRVKLGRNAFGSSARAQKIANLVKGYTHRKGLKL